MEEHTCIKYQDFRGEHDVPLGLGVGRYIGQDGHLVDVRVVFGVYIFQLRVQRGVAGTWLPTTRQQFQLIAAALDVDWATMGQFILMCRQAWGVE